MDALNAISPVDGRYRDSTNALSFCSEKGLIRYRVLIETDYFIALSKHQQIGLRIFSEQEQELLQRIRNLFYTDILRIKSIEKKTNHDVKAIEYFMKEKLKNTSLSDCVEWIHFALTSEDINNIAYGLMLSDSVGTVILPELETLYGGIEKLALKYKHVPMLARTHGQPASPTTVGKELKVFSSRLERQLYQLNHAEILVKLNGATGNYNAHYAAYPNIDWLNFTKEFIKQFNEERRIKLTPNLLTTQIEPGDSYSELFDNLRRINTILIDLNQDMWRYISDGWFNQKTIEDEVGSSTMPNKINPIDFENSEGNLGLANALFTYFSTKIPISRLQRDLSDSTVKRNFGVALAHSLIGYNSTFKGLNKIALNELKVIEDLEKHPEIITEAIQTVLRREGAKMPYEELKKLTRGKQVTIDDLKAFVDKLSVSDAVKAELKQLSPTNYTGIAELLVDLY